MLSISHLYSRDTHAKRLTIGVCCLWRSRFNYSKHSGLLIFARLLWLTFPSARCWVSHPTFMYALNHTEHSGMQYELLACIVIPSNPGTFISILNFRIAKALLARRCVFKYLCSLPIRLLWVRSWLHPF